MILSAVSKRPRPDLASSRAPEDGHLADLVAVNFRPDYRSEKLSRMLSSGILDTERGQEGLQSSTDRLERISAYL